MRWNLQVGVPNAPVPRPIPIVLVSVNGLRRMTAGGLIWSQHGSKPVVATATGTNHQAPPARTSTGFRSTASGARAADGRLGAPPDAGVRAGRIREDDRAGRLAPGSSAALGVGQPRRARQRPRQLHAACSSRRSAPSFRMRDARRWPLPRRLEHPPLSQLSALLADDLAGVERRAGHRARRLPPDPGAVDSRAAVAAGAPPAADHPARDREPRGAAAAGGAAARTARAGRGSCRRPALRSRRGDWRSSGG